MLCDDIERQVLLALRADPYLPDAARRADVNIRELEAWIDEGKRNPNEPAGKFAALVADALAGKAIVIPPPTLLHPKLRGRPRKNARG